MGEVELDDGGRVNVVEHGAGHPLLLLHAGPGLDHHEFRPWLDPLGGQGFRLLYIDMRGHGASPRVDPQTLSLRVFARDVDRIARALDLDEWSLLGHSFGAVVALLHALEHGTASRYVIVSGTASTEATLDDVDREIERFQPAAMRDQIRRSWQREASVRTVAEARDVSESQMPFHFAEMGDAYRAFMERDETVYAPEVLAHFAGRSYGGFERLDNLRWVSKPVLVIAGRRDRSTTVERAEEIANEIPDAKLVVIEQAAHMPFVEQPQAFMRAIRTWFTEQGVLATEQQAG
jgi:proline-specific peptidase